MRAFPRSIVAFTVAAGLAVPLALLHSAPVHAQAKQAPAKQAAPAAAQPAAPPPLKQIALTEKHIESVLASQKDMNAITDKIQENAKPDPKITAQLDGVAKKYGFADYADYTTAINNISLVLEGFDPQTKKYVGIEAILRAQIAEVQADKKMPPKDKKAALAELDEALKVPAPPVENKGNIDLVAKYYDKLADALLDEE